MCRMLLAADKQEVGTSFFKAVGLCLSIPQNLPEGFLKHRARPHPPELLIGWGGTNNLHSSQVPR